MGFYSVDDTVYQCVVSQGSPERQKQYGKGFIRETAHMITKAEKPLDRASKENQKNWFHGSLLIWKPQIEGGQPCSL